MAKLAIVFGIALALLAVIGYVATGGVSLTALIPAAFGILLVVLGRVARDESKRRPAMHAAVLVALIGFAGTASGILNTFRLLSGVPVARPGAAVAQAIMALLTGAFVVLGVRSFLEARRSRRTAA
ncbi:MAG: hypothetical protein HYS04_03970 [Acidobacteria bacterium]|nr:hypothetical protein [Acidobacteriota bacterium]